MGHTSSGQLRVLRALVLIFCAYAPLLSAAPVKPTYRSDPTYLIDTWETDDGLPENSATAMVQTADGYLWFGTFKGLVRFDGIKFTVFDSENTPQMPPGGVVGLHLDKSGRMWVSTLGGLGTLRDKQWETFGSKEGWEGDYVRLFTERANGDLLLTTWYGKVFEYTRGRLRRLPQPPGADNSAYFSCVDENQNWWVVQERFIGQWDGKSWISRLPLPKPSSVCAAAARDGGLWIVVNQELRKYQAGNLTLTQPLKDFGAGAWNLFEDSDANVWIATLDRGVYRVSPTGDLSHWTTANGLSFNGIRFVFEDREKTLWVGSSGGGLMRFKTRRFTSFGPHNGLSQHPVNSLAADAAGTVWIGTYGGGLFRLADGRVGSVPLKGDKGQLLYVQSVLCDRAGRTWVGSFDQRLWLIDKDGSARAVREQTGGGNILSMFEDSRARIWMGDGQHVSLYDNGQFRNIAEGFPNGGVCGFAEDSSGRIWLTNLAGIFRQDGERFVEVLNEQKQSIRQVLCLKADPDGTIWMGCSGRGLLRWQNGRLAAIDETLGFPASTVSSIVEDSQGDLWFGTSKGIVRACRTDLNAVIAGKIPRVDCKIFDVSDGLPGNDCTRDRQPTCVRDSAGRLWFAMLKGVAMVDPARLRINTLPPPTRLDRIVVYTSSDQRNEPATLGNNTVFVAPFEAPLLLPAGIRRLEFHYTALSHAAPERMRFAVKLNGLDRQWQEMGNQRVASYFDPGPGNYTFHMRAANNDGVWNETGSSIAFVVRPFFWQTLWFRVGAVLMLVGIGAGFMWWILGSRHRRSREKLRRTQRQSASIVRLSLSSALQAGDLKTALRDVTESSARVLGVDYASVWLLDEPAGELRCAAEFDASSTTHADGAVLKVSSYPEYMQCLRLHRSIVATDVLHDRRMVEFGHIYFTKRKIASTLDAAVRMAGKLVGVVCHQNMRHRSWYDDEVAFACAVADHVSQVLLNEERKKAESELTQQRSELTHLSRVAMLGELCGSLAHELNQPLTAILVNAEAAQEFLTPEKFDLDEVRSILRDIVGDDRRAGEVIRRLRVLFQKGEVQQHPLDVNEMVQDTLKLVQGDLVIQNVVAETELATNLPMVNGDQVQLQQVLLNLMANGCDAMIGVGTSDRKLTVRTELDSDCAVKISVADRGCGISHQQMQNIFTPFFTTKEKGMGLGLAVCRSIVQAHGGKLWAANETQCGARFNILLPAAATPK